MDAGADYQRGNLMRNLAFSTVVFAVIVAAGCSSDKGPNGGDPIPNVIAPLALGNTWGGTQIEYDSTGAEVVNFYQTFFINQDTTIAGERWFAIAGAKILLANRNDGVWIRYGFQDTLDLQDPSMYAMYPATVGQSWQSGIGLSATVIAVSVDTSITVPKGTYNCHLYRWVRDSGTRIDHYFIAPKTGWVKTEYYRFTDGGTQYLYGSWELEELVLK